MRNYNYMGDLKKFLVEARSTWCMETTNMKQEEKKDPRILVT